jgi:hypothetical protein
VERRATRVNGESDRASLQSEQTNPSANGAAPPARNGYNGSRGPSIRRPGAPPEAPSCPAAAQLTLLELTRRQRIAATALDENGGCRVRGHCYSDWNGAEQCNSHRKHLAKPRAALHGVRPLRQRLRTMGPLPRPARPATYPTAAWPRWLAQGRAEPRRSDKLWRCVRLAGESTRAAGRTRPEVYPEARRRGNASRSARCAPLASEATVTSRS